MPGNIHDVPLSVIESWPKPNYINPVRRGWLPAFATIWQVASSILVLGRFYLRVRRQAGPFGLDDVFILIGWAVAVGFTAVAWVDSREYGIDRHTWDVRLDQYVGAALLAWVAQVLMLVSSGAIKVSVLLFYRRMVVDTIARRWKLAIYFALTFHAVYLIGTLLAMILVCRPLEAYWKSYDFTWHKPYTCVDSTSLNPIIGSLSVVSDVYSVVLPGIILAHYQLDLPRRQKIGLNLIFATGLLVAGAGIARTYYLTRLGQVYDTSWEGFTLFAWSIVELQLGLICACAPTMRAFFRHYLKDTTRRSGSRSRSRTPGDSSQTYYHQKKKWDGMDMHVLTRPSNETFEDGGWATQLEPVSPMETAASSHPNQTEPVAWEREAGAWPGRSLSSKKLRREAEVYSTV